jgi:hypothetical protein
MSGTSTNNLSLSVGTTPTLVLPAGLPITYQRIINAGLAGTNGVAWCSYTSKNPAPNLPGSFPLAPYGNTLNQPSVEEFSNFKIIPSGPLYAVSDGGSSGSAPAILTIVVVSNSR